MKILILSQYWAPENGVPQRRWSWLSQMLVEQGHQITVIAPPPHYDRKISPAEWVCKFAAGGFNEEEIGDTGELILRSPFLPAGNSLTARALNQAFVGVGAVFRVLWRTGSLKGYKPDVIIGTVPAIPISMVVWLVSSCIDGHISSIFGTPGRICSSKRTVGIREWDGHHCVRGFFPKDHSKLFHGQPKRL